MKDEAVRAGDQAYGAVVVKDGRIIGFGPSRVVLKKDWTAHAEREAMREAQARLGTDRPLRLRALFDVAACAACERAAAQAKIARMYLRRRRDRRRRAAMIDHVSVARARSRSRAARFYEAVLGALGYSKLDDSPARPSASARNIRNSGSICAAAMTPIAAEFGQRTSACACARASGRRLPRRRARGRRRLRRRARAAAADMARGYYAAFIRDPDGNSIEAVTFLKAET